MDINLQTPLDYPLTIQLSDDQIIPFKVIIKCENIQLALYTYQRSVTKTDGFLFELINERNLKNLANDIQAFKIQLQEEFEKKEQFENRYETTCKIFFGTQYLQKQDGRRIYDNFKSYESKTQQLQQKEKNKSQMLISNKINPQQNPKESEPDQDCVRQKQDQIYQSTSQKTLVCGVYENETKSQIMDFIRSFKYQNVDLVILCNGIDSLELKLKECLFLNHMKSTLITMEIQRNQYSVDNALVLQYKQNQEDLPRVIFIIKYFKSSNYDLQRWIYNGIGKYFDPDYFFVTQCSLIQQRDSISTQINSIINRNLCAITGNILYNQISSWNPLNISNTFLLDQTIDELENISTNKVFSIAMDHNPFFCFYNWQKVKQFIGPYLQKIIKSECDYVQNIILQGVNYILPSLAAEKGLFFGKSDNVVAQAHHNNSLSKNMNEQRKRKNSKIYSYSQFQESYSSQSQDWQINSLTKIIQEIVLKLVYLYSSINNYFSISAIIFIFVQSSYDFFGNAFDYYYLYIVKFSIPALFIFTVVIFLIFAILFTSQQKIARSKGIKDPILISGNLVLHIIHSHSFNYCSYTIENLQQTALLTIDDNVSEKFKFIGYSPNRNVLNLFLEYEKSIYCAYQYETNIILEQILKEAQLRGKSISKNDFVEYFAQVNVKRLCFNYQNQKGDASEQFSILFYCLGIFNFIFVAIFILNLVFNYYIKVEDSYRLLVCVTILIMLLEKTIQMLLYSSHMSIFVRGYLSYLFYYLVVNFGMRFYEKINTDKDNESERIKEFYYTKVESFAIWITYNIAFLFICFMIEAYYDFCGYVLLFFLCYCAACSLLTISFNVISKFLCFYYKNVQNEKNQEQPESETFLIEQFVLSEKTNYEDQFLKIKQQAYQNFFESQIKLDEFKTRNLNLNQQNRLSIIQENSLQQSLQNSTCQLQNENKIPIQNYEKDDDDDDLLHSNMRIIN